MKSLAERFWPKVRRTATCWLWTAAVYPKTGAGAFSIGQRKIRPAHRVAWELERGPIPAGATLRNTCGRLCVRPEHHVLVLPVQRTLSATEARQAADLYREHAGELRKHLQARGLSAEDAEDVIHDVFARAKEHLRHLRSGASMRAFLCLKARGAMWQLRQSRKRELLVAPKTETVDGTYEEHQEPDCAPGPDEVLEMRGRADAVERVLAQLTPQRRRALEAFEVEHRTQADVARELGISETSVRTLVWGARTRFDELALLEPALQDVA